MITAFAVFLVLGIVVFLATRRLSLPKRVIIAATVFLLPSIGLTVWVWSIGDKPPPDSARGSAAPRGQSGDTRPQEGT